jgi:hypothetical protein
MPRRGVRLSVASMNHTRADLPSVARMLMTAIATAAVALAVASPARAVTGLISPLAYSTHAAATKKTAISYCPASERVVGGGGDIETDDPMHARRDLVLTQMEPVHPLSGPDYYIVSGEEAGDKAHGDWWVRAIARCAQPVAGQHIVIASTTLSSPAYGYQTAKPTCPHGERVLGGGAWIVLPTAGHIGITEMEASAAGDLVYAEANEDASGYSGDWNVTGFAVCAPEPDGYTIATGETAGDSWTELSEAYCIYPRQVLGSGGQVTPWAAGDVMLTAAEPWGGERVVSATGVENTATSSTWSIRSQAICAY